ncbi:MAG: T9SS type A sorting domain-containing protein [Rhodobacteraceae bacterium]|nr:T9SS type A sorting domain-containing protein [Paracoccaceae bacterium]
MYPNPSSGLISLSANNVESLKITSLLGSVVFEKDKLEEKTMDIRHLPAGVYNCSYYSKNIYHSEKLLLIK